MCVSFVHYVSIVNGVDVGQHYYSYVSISHIKNIDFLLLGLYGEYVSLFTSTKYVRLLVRVEWFPFVLLPIW